MEDKKIKKTDEKEYIIPLRKGWEKTPKYRRGKRTIRIIKLFLLRHMKVRDGDFKKIKIDKSLNEFIWARGIKKPPIKIKVKVKKEKDIVYAELSEIPEKIKFKIKKLEKREGKSLGTKKKKEEKKEEKDDEKEENQINEEKKKELQEKKLSVIESGKKDAKEMAKMSKHKTKNLKQTHQKRVALQK